MSREKQPDLLADVGGTNVRFALAHGNDHGPVRRYAVADFPGPIPAIQKFLSDIGATALPRRAILAFAGPVEQIRARLTNSIWETSDDALKAAFGFETVMLINDFEALGWALPRIRPSDLFSIGGGTARQNAPMAVLGAGTGMGCGAYIPAVPHGTALATEGGHVTLAAANSREAAILDFLRDRHGHVSAERVLSGMGLEALYQAVLAVDKIDAPSRNAAQITEHAVAGDCSASLATLNTFCAMLGGFAGNLALTLGAKGGVFIAGGIVPRFQDFLAMSEFRERFEAKGRFRTWLQAVPTCVITHPEPAFPGLIAALAARRDGP